jgi:hypothetical protein
MIGVTKRRDGVEAYLLVVETLAIGQILRSDLNAIILALAGRGRTWALGAAMASEPRAASPPTFSPPGELTTGVARPDQPPAQRPFSPYRAGYQYSACCFVRSTTTNWLAKTR